MDIANYDTTQKPTWCPGCGNFGIWVALKMALSQLNISSHEVVIVFDIGCSGNGSNFIKCYGFHGLHGRALPIATGIKLVSNKTKVIIMGGDGGTLGIGMGHFIHSCRRNIDMTLIIHDNQVYGLTTGQTAPTSEKGYKSKSTPFGVLEEPVIPTFLGLASGASFVGQGFSGQMSHLVELFKKGINYKGFALVNVLQPCVTYNHVNTFEFFQKRTYKLEDVEYDPTNYEEALKKSREWGEKIPLGVIYNVEKPSYEDGLNYIEFDKLTTLDEIGNNISSLLKEYS